MSRKESHGPEARHDIRLYFTILKARHDKTKCDYRVKAVRQAAGRQERNA